MTRTRNAAEEPNTEARAPRYRLRLFVAGDEPNSAKARSVLARVCESHLRGRYELEVVDVFEDYQAAIDSHVLMVPTLIVEEPPPTRIVVGSFRDVDVLVDALGLPVAEDLS
jgi:circadian clock protein KaiB